MRGNTPENMAFLRSLIIMCLADGKVVKAERDTIRALVSHMQYTDFDVDYAIRRETARLYAEARRNDRKKKKRAETTA